MTMSPSQHDEFVRDHIEGDDLHPNQCVLRLLDGEFCIRHANEWTSGCLRVTLSLRVDIAGAPTFPEKKSSLTLRDLDRCREFFTILSHCAARRAPLPPETTFMPRDADFFIAADHSWSLPDPFNEGPGIDGTIMILYGTVYVGAKVGIPLSSINAFASEIAEYPSENAGVQGCSDPLERR
ncbi:MAG: hypothetical protein HYV07_28725 [Deltaproteobacteria bacterium]|nr:hypothetical protein [Deltaproteobacteria bacterium]